MFLRALPVLTLLLAATPALSIDFSDHWWNPDRSGRGIMIVQRGDQAYAIVSAMRSSTRWCMSMAPAATTRCAS